MGVSLPSVCSLISNPISQAQASRLSRYPPSDSELCVAPQGHPLGNWLDPLRDGVDLVPFVLELDALRHESGEPLVGAEDDSPAERPDPFLRLLAAEDLERVLRKRVQPTHLEYGADVSVRGEDDGPPAPERPFLKKRLVGGLHGGVSP